MKTLEASERYIRAKRSSGCAFESGTKTLRAFAKFVGDITLEDVRANDILSFLNRKLTTRITWRSKHWALRRFFDYWSHRGIMPLLIMPALKPYVGQSFVPYIYTQLEIRRLLEAISREKRPTQSIASGCLSSILVFLYATGSCISETSRILLSDLDLEGASVTIKNARSNRKRLLPLGADLVQFLRPYVLWRTELKCENRALFVTTFGVTVSVEKLGRAFRRLRCDAGVFRRDGASQKPRVEDLRHTFAVHHIDKWIRDGADLNRMLPALAAYMGQNGLGATHRYLFMTPERFRKDLDKLSPSGGRGGWGEDQALMKFLSEL